MRVECGVIVHKEDWAFVLCKQRSWSWSRPPNLNETASAQTKSPFFGKLLLINIYIFREKYDNVARSE
ncbi:hypothetical protein AAHA92_24482 [Salvia divinorum]|uniref:Uncharacterized protein n=1 Tax=Salvia divinorum TaxID=28513 RepID=A0ABD1G7G5_SALDI